MTKYQTILIIKILSIVGLILLITVLTSPPLEDFKKNHFQLIIIIFIATVIIMSLRSMNVILSVIAFVTGIQLQLSGWLFVIGLIVSSFAIVVTIPLYLIILVYSLIEDIYKTRKDKLTT